MVLVNLRLDGMFAIRLVKSLCSVLNVDQSEAQTRMNERDLLSLAGIESSTMCCSTFGSGCHATESHR